MLLPERWTRLWLAATKQPPPAGGYERLLGLYAGPHRHYHNQQHVADCLEQFDQARQFAVAPDAVEFAIWFHDAIYDTRAGDNEERSADLAQECLQQAGATKMLTDGVRRLILATKAHDGSLHPDAPLLVDIDLSILGRAPEKFCEYEKAIRAEYAWVEPTLFAAKRADILRRFFARPRLYHTDFFFGRYEGQARTNLRASLDQLQRCLHS